LQLRAPGQAPQLGILNAGTMDRRLPLYKDLLKVTRKTRLCAEAALRELRVVDDLAALRFAKTLEHYLPLVSRVVDQAERRVLAGEQARFVVSAASCRADDAVHAPRSRSDVELTGRDDN
jgi:hypothetical protein